MEIDWFNFLATPIFGAVVGFFVWYFQTRLEAIRREQDKLQDDRRKVYADILEPIIRVFAGIRNPRENQKALTQMASFEWKRTAFEFSLIGSDEVVRSFNDMMQYLYKFDPESDQKADPGKLMLLWGVLLLEIRKNVGNPNTTLSPSDMLKSHIKDIDNLFPKG